MNTEDTSPLKPAQADPSTMVTMDAEISKNYKQFVEPAPNEQNANTMFKACPDHVAFADAQGGIGTSTERANYAAAPFQMAPIPKGQTAAPGL